ncbi:MAG: FAD-dependent oxidoreductase [bacterium]|nr:FAD-dependent oxidoreductase [bacterium]
MKISATTLKKLAIVLVLIGLFVVFFQQGWHEQITFENLKSRQGELRASVEENQALWVVGFALAYIVMAAAQLPGAALMTIAGGVLFGLVLGTLVVSFASTIGATVAMLVSRYLFRDSIQKRYGHKLRAFNEGIKKEGGFYLFTLRLIPVVPFFLINLGAGLTKMRTWTFYWVSQLGMLAGTAVYVNAGDQIGKLESASGLLSPQLWGAFVLLALFPFIARKIMNVIKARRVFRKHQKPDSYDYNVVVIGAGSGGLVASLISAAVKAKVALIEKHQMGGDCLNTGCVPSKALIRSAKMLHYAKRAEDWGFRSAEVDFDFAQVMDRVHRVIKEIEPHDSVERYTGLGVDCVEGEATIESPWKVRVGDRVLTTRNIVIATGAGPLVPPIPGLDQVDPLTSDNLWELRELPRRLVVLGGGPIGSEMTQAFARLGSEVTQVEMLPRILSREDPEISDMVKERFEEEGVRVLTGHKATSFGVDDAGRYMLAQDVDSNEVRIDFDQVIVALGRRPRVKGFGLEEMGIEIAPNGTVQSDEFLRTNYPNIYVCGDVAGPYQFTHVASHQAWYASVNALFSPFKEFKADYRVIPWTTFTDPEVARVGLNELEAKEQEIPYEVSTYGIDDLDRAIADGEAYGVVKVLTQPGKDRILGVTIAGPHAGDLMAEYVLAMKHGLGLNKILGTIHTYPTLAEANKYAAGVWKKAHAPEKVLAMVEKFHAWRRGEPLSGRTRAAAAAATLIVALAIGGVAMTSRGSTDMPLIETELVGLSFTDAAYTSVLERVDGEGLVDYAGLSADRGSLDATYASLATLDPAEYESWSEERQIAFWSNAYNALTLLAIVENYPIERKASVGSIMHPRGIRWIPGVWDKLSFKIMGRDMTLNDIEHQVLRVEYDEPRIHAALVCAAISCPPLRGEPFVEERLDEQLDDQTRRFLDRSFRIDREAGKVYLSKILDWYGGDFEESYEPEEGFEGHGDAERAVLNFIAGYLDEADGEYLRSGDYDVEYSSYDWSLNDQSTKTPGG